MDNGRNERPDLILFVNGLSLVVIELKNAAYENTILQSAFRQLETYKGRPFSVYLQCTDCYL